MDLPDKSRGSKMDPHPVEKRPPPGRKATTTRSESDPNNKDNNKEITTTTTNIHSFKESFAKGGVKMTPV